LNYKNFFHPKFHPKKKILSLFTQPQVVLNLYEVQEGRKNIKEENLKNVGDQTVAGSR